MSYIMTETSPKGQMSFDANAKRITKKGTTKERAYAAIALFVAAGLALGACGVRLSGRSSGFA